MSIIPNESLNMFEEIYGMSEEDIFLNDSEIAERVNILVDYNCLFNSKFKDLLNFFHMENEMETYQFLKENDNIFSIIDDIKIILNKYFNEELFVFRIIHDPEMEESLLNIIVKVDYNKNNMDNLLNKLDKVNSEIRPLKRKHNLIGAFLIDVECL
jgi:hypothetical protein